MPLRVGLCDYFADNCRVKRQISVNLSMDMILLEVKPLFHSCLSLIILTWPQ